MDTKNTIIPFQATHPGVLLADELKSREINQKDFAVEMGMQRTMLNEILKGKRPVTADVALLLENALKIPADYWLKFQSQYELDKARIKEKNVQKLFNIDLWRIIKEYVPIKYFKKLHYLVDNLNNDIAKIKEIYNINNVDDLIGLSATQKFELFRKSEKLKISEKNVLAWNMVAKYEAKNQKVEAFNPSNKENIIAELQHIFYENKDSVVKVKQTLNKYGIKLVLIPKLEQTPVDGFTFWSGENPAIALTLRHNRVDNFAFTINHELGHIFLHLLNDKNMQFFDIDSKKQSMEIVEKEADNFAQKSLISDTIWNEMDEYSLTDEEINQLAAKNKIHPAIILGRKSFELKNYAMVTTIDKKLY